MASKQRFPGLAKVAAHLVCLLIVLAAWPAGAQTVTYVHTDALGSVEATTDANGNVVERYDYEPYGAPVGAGIQDGPAYTGHVSDSATGLSYMQQRYMDPELGVFLSVDPVTAYQKPIDQFNRYRYANGNPYRYTDPDGRLVETVWDVANIAMGANSAYSNFSQGNVGAGVVDSIGVAIDTTAAAVPFVPGGAGAGIKAARATGTAVDAARSGRNANKLRPDPNASGAHSTFKRGEDGNISNTATYELNSNNPTGFQEVKRVDVTGKAHVNPDGSAVATPHVKDAGQKGVRPALPEDLPKLK
ncbi:RHS repeat-associated core domain-containing protein [Stenotrophomonas sp. AB1(2024)]|uniref:RHS repeat-associated core domain-containing protein n=1 Tax=Stenotrophomonas sp. AB1(2024) TaxID=3132215 RepID=UPI0030A56C11